MSTPPFLALPPGARPERWTVSRGSLAAVVAEPAPGVAVRGTAVLVPGFTGSKEDFVAVLAPLMDRGWRVVSFDLLGQYESAGPDDEASYALDLLGADVAEVLAAVRARWDGPVQLLGHSLGGLVARQAVLLAGAAGQALPDTVTLLCSGPGPIPGARAVMLHRLLEVLPGAPLDLVWEAKEEADRANGWEPASAEVGEFVRRRFLANSPYALRAKATILVETADRVDELAALTAAAGVPVLVLYGEFDDAWTLDEQAVMAERLGAQPLVLAGAGHSPAVDAPHATADLLDGFWRSGDPCLADFPPGPADAGAGLRRTGDRYVTPGVGPVPDGYTHDVHVETSMPWEPTAPRSARQVLRDALGSDEASRWGAERRADDAALVLSELVTNAVRHGRAPLLLTLELRGRLLRIEVRDGDPTRVPAARNPATDESGGRGIALVNALVDRWGWARRADGKVVWAELTDWPTRSRADSGARSDGDTTAHASSSGGTSSSSASARPSHDARAAAAR